MRHLQQEYEKYREKGFLVLGLNTAARPSIGRRFLDQSGVEFPAVVDPSRPAREISQSRYQTIKGVTTVPVTYVIDREGKIAARWVGKRPATVVDEVRAKLGLE